MRVLILGSTGFIGRNLKEQLPYELLTPSRKELDLNNLTDIDVYFKKNNIDVVINAIKDRDVLIFNFLCWCFKGKIIQIGSGAEYGKQGNIKSIKENDFGKVIPKDEYGFEKYWISILNKKYVYRKVKNIIVLRPFGVFGKYEDTNRRFISKAILDNLIGKDITIYQDVKFSYVWVNDLVQIIDYFINNDPKYQFYNVGGHQITLVRIAKKIGKYKVLEKGMANEYTCDDSRVRNETRIKYTPFDKSLKELKKYYEKIYV